MENITDKIKQILAKDNRVTYKRVVDYMTKNHIQIFTIPNVCSLDIWITKGVSENPKDCIPTLDGTKEFFVKLDYALNILYKDSVWHYKREQLKLVKYLDNNEYDIMATNYIGIYKQYVRTKGYPDIVVLRPLYLLEVLDRSRIPELNGEIMPMF